MSGQIRTVTYILNSMSNNTPVFGDFRTYSTRCYHTKSDFPWPQIWSPRAYHCSNSATSKLRRRKPNVREYLQEACGQRSKVGAKFASRGAVCLKEHDIVTNGRVVDEQKRKRGTTGKPQHPGLPYYQTDPYSTPVSHGNSVQAQSTVIRQSLLCCGMLSMSWKPVFAGASVSDI